MIPVIDKIYLSQVWVENVEQNWERINQIILLLIYVEIFDCQEIHCWAIYNNQKVLSTIIEKITVNFEWSKFDYFSLCLHS